MLVGTQVGQQAGQMLTQLPPAGTAAPPPVPQAVPLQFHIVLNGRQTGPFPLTVIEQMLQAGTFGAATLVWRQGMAGWQAANTVPDLATLFAAAPPGPPPVPPTT